MSPCHNDLIHAIAGNRMWRRTTTAQPRRITRRRWRRTSPRWMRSCRSGGSGHLSRAGHTVGMGRVAPRARWSSQWAAPATTVRVQQRPVWAALTVDRCCEQTTSATRGRVASAVRSRSVVSTASRSRPQWAHLWRCTSAATRRCGARRRWRRSRISTSPTTRATRLSSRRARSRSCGRSVSAATVGLGCACCRL